MDTPKTITEQIHGCGLSDTEVALRVGSSQPTIWRIRNGKTTECSSDLYRKLAALRDELTVGTSAVDAEKQSFSTPASPETQQAA